MVPLVITAHILADPIAMAEPMLRQRASMVVRKTIFDGVAYARDHCPVASGDLKGSIHEFFEDDLNGGWGTDIEYAPHVNYGTVNMAARPFMTDSVEFVFPSFKLAMQELAK